MATKPLKTKFRCAICNARLEEGRYVYSRFTKNRYCENEKGHYEIIRKKKRDGPLRGRDG
jgi:hypothetical protein